jgi:predicted type IV restriction endonuclease
MLAEVFGYDKYTDLTSEYCIRGTYCDLALKVSGEIKALVEIKAIGTELKAAHTKQAVDYGANKGIEWVVLTNGVNWKIYKIIFGKPIDTELIAEFNFENLSVKDEAAVSTLYLLCKESWEKSILGVYHNQKEGLNRFLLSALIQSEAFVENLRRELRKINPDIKLASEQITKVLLEEVIKRETLEGEKAEEYQKKVQKHFAKQQREKEKKAGENTPPIPVITVETKEESTQIQQPEQ